MRLEELSSRSSRTPPNSGRKKRSTISSEKPSPARASRAVVSGRANSSSSDPAVTRRRRAATFSLSPRVPTGARAGRSPSQRRRNGSATVTNFRPVRAAPGRVGGGDGIPAGADPRPGVVRVQLQIPVGEGDAGLGGGGQKDL